jgi:hypothetical protein
VAVKKTLQTFEYRRVFNIFVQTPCFWPSMSIEPENTDYGEFFSKSVSSQSFSIVAIDAGIVAVCSL